MRSLIFGLCVVASLSTVSASIIVTPEAAGVQTSSVPGTTVVDFDSLTVGPLGTYVSPIGTYQPGAQIVAPDVYGGAGNTQYISVGAQSDTSSYELDFLGPQAYFGFYWMAADPLNEFILYNGSTVVGDYHTSDIFPLDASYNGLPSNGGSDPNEQFAFINFQSDDTSTNFTKVVFINNGFTSGFETDNHTILAGTTVSPEPSTYLLMAGGLVLIGLMARRRATNN